MPDGQINLHWAQQHVLRARQIVADQEARIARVKLAGGDPAGMVDLLETFREMLALFEDDLLHLRQAKMTCASLADQKF